MPVRSDPISRNPGRGMALVPSFPRARLLPLAIIVLFITSCSFDYGSSKSNASEEEPTAIFIGFVHHVVDKGTIILEIHAARAESFEKDHRTELTGVNFTQFDSKGALQAAGRADSATVWTDSDNAEFRGNVILESKREKATLKAEKLTWTDSTKTLEGGLERTVSIDRDDGAWVSGAGFRADLRRRSFSFSEASEGKIVSSSQTPASPSQGTPR